MNEQKDLQKTLKEATHRTIAELYSKFNFIVPKLYDATFSRKMMEMGVAFSEYRVEEELKALLAELDVKTHSTKEHFSKLLAFSDQALNAMENKDTRELQTVQNETRALVEQMKELEQKAYYDTITGLLNRNGLYQKVCSNGKLLLEGVLFFIDLDRFKHINDTYGHQYGDAALKAFAGLVQKQFTNVPEEQKFLCRLGGDEFVVVIAKENAPYAHVTFRRFQETPYKMTFKEAQEPLGFSFGAALFAKSDTFERVLVMADQAMYNNKKSRKENAHA